MNIKQRKALLLLDVFNSSPLVIECKNQCTTELQRAADGLFTCTYYTKDRTSYACKKLTFYQLWDWLK